MENIFSAAFAGDVDAIRRAVESGVDPNLPHERAGTLPLQLACQGDSTDAVSALLACGADAGRVFSRVSRVDGRQINDHVPLMYANSPKVAQLLLEAGASLEAADDLGMTPIVWAVARGDPAMVEFYLERGASTRVLPLVDRAKISLLSYAEKKLRFLEELCPGTKSSEQMNALANVRRCWELLNAQGGAQPEGID